MKTFTQHKEQALKNNFRFISLLFSKLKKFNLQTQKNSFSITITCMIFLSCTNDLELSTENKIASDKVWKNAVLAEAAVTYLYNAFGTPLAQYGLLSNLSDESYHLFWGENYDLMGTRTPANVDFTGWEWYGWNHQYTYIRAANVAIEQLEKSEFLEKKVKETLLGQAHFVRAYCYHRLAGHYGGVPIIEKPLFQDSNLKVSRNTFAEVIDFIVKDCDKAIQFLAGKTLANGRANENSAIALKSRVLIRAASDLHHIPTASAKIPVIASYVNKALLGYTKGNQTQRYEAAKVAAKKLIDKAKGYKLNLSAPASFNDAVKNYENVYLHQNGGESDIILMRTYYEDRNFKGNGDGINYAKYNGPNGYNGWGGLNPLQNLVDDYRLKDGKKFDWNFHWPYTEREPRFYATILYNRSKWKKRPDNTKSYDPYNEIQTCWFQVYDNAGKEAWLTGVDLYNGPVNSQNGTWTGYYYKKFMNASDDFNIESDLQYISFPLFRYTEVVFNYIEACLKTGAEAVARTWLNKIRFRAGLPATTNTGEALWQDYVKEKKLEMVLEEQRYYDTRRWLIAPTTLGKKAKRIEISVYLKSGKKRAKNDPYDKTKYYDSFENDHYEIKNISAADGDDRVWKDKSYFWPISREEINANPKLKQNPGY